MIHAKVLDITDGDTFDVRLNLVLGLEWNIRCRLRNIDTAEIYGVSHDSPEYKAGIAQMEFVADWFDEAVTNHDGEWPFLIREYGWGKYPRLIVEIKRKSDGTYLSDALRKEFKNF